MTVAELIEKLKKAPQDAMMIVPGGGHGGFDEALGLYEFDIITNVYDRFQTGNHEALAEFDENNPYRIIDDIELVETSPGMYKIEGRVEAYLWRSSEKEIMHERKKAIYISPDEFGPLTWNEAYQKIE